MTNENNVAAGESATTLQVASNIEAIAALHASAERSVPRHQRVIESITRNLGRPASLYLMLALVSVWILYNITAHLFRMSPFDPPPFAGLQGLASVSALLVATMVLITQNRQARLAEQRSHLDIQVNLLAEQKITKLIQLVEELRRDLPNVRNRHDPEVELLKQPAEPLAVMEELERNMENLERIGDDEG